MNQKIINETTENKDNIFKERRVYSPDGSIELSVTITDKVSGETVLFSDYVAPGDFYFKDPNRLIN